MADIQVANKVRPIIFNGDMVCAILAGRKTQTRRVIKRRLGILGFYPGNTWKIKEHPGSGWWATDGDFPEEPFDKSGFKCPYGVPGDNLWVRETFGHDPYRKDKVIYKAGLRIDPDYPIKWKPPIHMPHKFSRITLDITRVRVERVQDIKPVEVISEGIYEPHYGYTKSEGIAAILRMEYVWNSNNAKRGYSWDSNPWVWVLEFEVANE